MQSVLAQSCLPQCWMIVDDGSTDTTASIVKNYTRQYPFVRYHYREKPQGQAYFASNVYAIMAGYELIKEQDFAFLAILDADIVLPKGYYSTLLTEFEKDSRLGVASGIYDNLINGSLEKVLHDRRSTPKAIQVFRREVFDSIGGFLPLKYGGEDTISCVMARMAGWKAWSFPEIKTVHLRPTGTGVTSNILRVRFRQGLCEYHLAAHPVFFTLKCLRRAVLERPLLVGGFLRLAGYMASCLRREPRQLPKDVIQWIRKEQLQRILNGNSVRFEKLRNSSTL